jgi:mevalonate kinase
MKASAPAKVIILGEHSSLYGNPALVAALDLRARVTVSKRRDAKTRITAKDLGIEKAPPRRNERGTALIRRGIELMGGGYGITVESDIPLASGMGSSAAISVALMKALESENGIESDMRKIALEAQKCEQEVHGKSSGLDVFASAYGGVIRYQNQKAEILKLERYPRLIIAHSGIESDTGDIVADIEDIRSEKPSQFNSFLDDSERFVFLGMKALENGDWESLGKQMDANHKLLSDMGCSCKRLESLVNAAREAGAYGAKLCGAGRGGIIVALVDENSEKGVKEALSRMDAKIIESNISEKGVQLE